MRETYHGVVNYLVLNEQIFQKRRMLLAKVLVIGVFVHSRLAICTNGQCEQPFYAS